MIKKFEMDGKEGEFDYDKHIIKYDGKLISPDLVDSIFLAKMNKALRDANPIKPVILNIGSGNRPRHDCINLDYDKDSYPDVVRDVGEGLPFDTDKFEGVYTSHVIEHVKDVFFFVYEIWRVTKNKGKVVVIAPYCENMAWAVQPDHVRMINYDWFERWEPNWTSVQNEFKQTRGAKFNVLSTRIFNEGRELEFILEVVK